MASIRCCCWVTMIVVLCMWFSMAEATEEGSRRRGSKDMRNDVAAVDSVASIVSVSSATTTAATPLADKDPDEEPIDSNDSTLDDFEDTLPDGPGSGVETTTTSLEGVAAGISKAFDLFQTLTTVWETVSSAQTSAANTAATVTANGTSTSESGRQLTEAARYIKGDPLRGYYDFIITEGSYKFWAVFQLLTAVLMIYSTFAAIYYSKVNPIVSDYDYVSYLGGRSLGSASAGRSATDAEGAHPLHSLLNAGWMQTAAHGFEWVLEAVERIPA